jgi:hypothetical protein
MSGGVQLEGYINGGYLLLSVLDYQEELKRVVVTAYAEALAAAAELKKADGCLAWANAGGCIYTPEHPDTRRPNCGGKNIADFECTAAAVSVGAIEEIDAVATASALPPQQCMLSPLNVKCQLCSEVHCGGAVQVPVLQHGRVGSLLRLLTWR